MFYSAPRLASLSVISDITEKMHDVVTPLRGAAVQKIRS